MFWKSSTESNISTSLILNIGFWILSSNMKTLKVWGICEIEAPRSEVFVEKPCNSVGAHLLLEERIHGWGSPCKSRRWNRLSVSFFTSSDRFPCTVSHWVSACSTLIPRVKQSLIRSQWRIDHCTWTVRLVYRCTKQTPCFKSQTLVAAQHPTKTWNNCRLTGSGIIFHCKLILHLEIL